MAIRGFSFCLTTNHPIQSSQTSQEKLCPVKPENLSNEVPMKTPTSWTCCWRLHTHPTSNFTAAAKEWGEDASQRLPSEAPLIQPHAGNFRTPKQNFPSCSIKPSPTAHKQSPATINKP